MMEPRLLKIEAVDESETSPSLAAQPSGPFREGLAKARAYLQRGNPPSDKARPAVSMPLLCDRGGS